MKEKFAIIGALLAFVALVSTPVGAARYDRFVNPFNTCDAAQIAGKPTHLTIQDAVTAALVNETIGVCAGTYTEQVTVSTQGLTLRRVDAADVNVFSRNTCRTQFPAQPAWD